MIMDVRSKLTQLLLIILLPATSLFGQEINIGRQDSIESEVLKETRKFLIKLPKDYDSSDRSYPVLYRLDGDLNLFIETAGTVQRLVYREELIPEMIVVLIENTHRNRDMMPTNTGFFTGEPGADNFKMFIEDELIPHMSSSYRISDEKILCGQSLSSIFVLYCFLTSPNIFDSYIASSAGFPDCEDYFLKLTKKMLEDEKKEPKKIFLSYGAKDFLDPEGVMRQQISNFVQLIETDNSKESRFKIYEDENHVPYQSLYHGLKYLYE